MRHHIAIRCLPLRVAADVEPSEETTMYSPADNVFLHPWEMKRTPVSNSTAMQQRRESNTINKSKSLRTAHPALHAI
jgi:hypothetical protein